ncbi:hypothetical protein CDAR_281491 [Caerostris darwini]|uniref:Uncharacterized protein n=1 Tax=Caerostris darwini TaxID=1538125 RepID=A0AAV4QYQ8_9ARAC|nr:hypothetical protein CDAR_281491 [Caerostris darwini]
MALRVSQIECTASEQGMPWTYLGGRWPFSWAQNIKWNSISTSPKQKKKRKLQSNSIQVYSEMENSSSYFQPSPPPSNSISSPPYAILSIPNTSSLIFRTSGKTEVKMGPLPVTPESLKFFDSMCSFRTGVALELFGQKMAVFSAAEHKMEFNQYFSKAEKRTETPVEQHSSIL